MASPTLRQTKADWMRNELPYGLVVKADGREILYNRFYEPIWQKMPQGNVERADLNEPVGRVAGGPRYYDENDPPWESRSALKRCNAALEAWSVPVPDASVNRLKPRAAKGLVYQASQYEGGQAAA